MMNATKAILFCAAAVAVAGATAQAAGTNEMEAVAPKTATNVETCGIERTEKAHRSSVTQADLESSPLARLAKAIEDGDAAFVAKHVLYPLGRATPLPSIANEEEFVEHFPILFDEAFRERMRAGSFTNDWTGMGWRGTMFGNGELWVDCGDIYGVNYQSDAERNFWKAAVEAERKTLHESIAGICDPVDYFVTEDGKTAGRIDALDANRDFVRIALFDTPVRQGAKPSSVFQAWNGPGIWLGADWRNALLHMAIGTDMTPTFILYEKKSWDDAKFSICRPAESSSWNSILQNANVRPSRFDEFGTLCESPPANAALLDHSGALALFSGETAEDAAFNESIGREASEPPRKRRSLFFRWRAQDGTDEWRLMLTTGLKSIDLFFGWDTTRELLDDVRERFEVDDAALCRDELAWDVVCRTRNGSRVACRLWLDDGLRFEPADRTAENYLRKYDENKTKSATDLNDSELDDFLDTFM